MERIVQPAPITAVCQGAFVRTHNARLIYDPAEPCWAQIVCDEFVLWLSRDSLRHVEDGPQTEACGNVELGIYERGAFRWVVVEVDTVSLPDSRLTLPAVLCAEFIDRVYDAVPAGLEDCFAVLADEYAFAAEFASLAGVK